MGLLTAFCNNSSTSASMTPDEYETLHSVKITVGVITRILCVFGIAGNVLNLRTLQSASLQTVPFMYIRALAVFDLIGLLGVLVYTLSEYVPEAYLKYVYKAHVEFVLINTFFIGGLNCAFLLTVERYLLISRPHYRQSNPKRVARRRIALAWSLAFATHVPLAVQMQPRLHGAGRYTVANNVALICRAPWFTIFTYYKFLRECIRFSCVIAMTTLNLVIARRLQITKRKRREMCLRSAASSAASIATVAQPSARSSLALSMETLQSRREWLHLLRSFTEKKLTVLMFGICLIYMLGNLPQMLVMILQDESAEHNFGFQVYRQVGNTLEVLNHCLNFYVFCMASSEYSRAFLTHCRCLRRLLGGRLPNIQTPANTQINGSPENASAFVRGGMICENLGGMELRDVTTSSSSSGTYGLTSSGGCRKSSTACTGLSRIDERPPPPLTPVAAASGGGIGSGECLLSPVDDDNDAWYLSPCDEDDDVAERDVDVSSTVQVNAAAIDDVIINNSHATATTTDSSKSAHANDDVMTLRKLTASSVASSTSLEQHLLLPGDSPDEGNNGGKDERKPLRGILVNPSGRLTHHSLRLGRGKRSLTIVNSMECGNSDAGESQGEQPLQASSATTSSAADVSNVVLGQ